MSHARTRPLDAERVALQTYPARSLARNLHDGAQRLVTRSLQLGLAQQRLREDPFAAASLLAQANDDLKLAKLRELARGLHPAILTDRGLEAAFQALAERAPFPVEVTGVPAERLNEAVEVALYYVVAECRTNAAKHGEASVARVDMSITDGTAVVEIRDDGRGGADLGAGSGLRSLADRVEALGGRLDVTPTRCRNDGARPASAALSCDRGGRRGVTRRGRSGSTSLLGLVREPRAQAANLTRGAARAGRLGVRPGRRYHASALFEGR